MEFDRRHAEAALTEAHASNPGPWADHSRYVAQACQRIAERCPGLDSELAYLYGLLHDIGRFAGVTSERHLLDGYRYCMERGWEKAGQICISHGFPIQDIRMSVGVFDMPEADKAFLERYVAEAEYDDYDYLVQLCDALALPTGFCLLETRFVDVALRYGLQPCMPDRWRRYLALKAHFEELMGCSLYSVLPGAAENCLTV